MGNANVFDKYYERQKGIYPIIDHTGLIIGELTEKETIGCGLKAITVNRVKKCLQYDATSVGRPDAYIDSYEFGEYAIC